MKAIILAAGRGTRLLPFTLQKPKPLLEIKGKSILENMILHLNAMGVNDIIVVSGYKSEQFIPLAKKLNFKLLVNENYENTNSTASMQIALDSITLDYIDDILVLNGDSYILNLNDIFAKLDPKYSTIIAQVITQTQEITWSFTAKNNKITHINTNSKGGICETGLVYLCKNDVLHIRNLLKQQNTNDYWECVFLKHLNTIYLKLLETKDSIYEIDTFKDTKNFLSAKNFALQCSDNNEATRLGGFTNYNFLITIKGEKKVLRIPGIGTESFVDREAEKAIVAILPKEVSTASTFFKHYIKMTDYLEGYSDMVNQSFDTPFFKAFCKTLRILHSTTLLPNFKPISNTNEILKYESLAQKEIVSKSQRDFILQIAKKLESDTQVLCHRDLLCGNIMYNQKEVKLVDFEYSGFSSKYWDIANFICESNVNEIQRAEFISTYGALDDIRVREAQTLVHYIWGLWYLVNKIPQEQEKHRYNLQRNLKLLGVEP